MKSINILSEEGGLKLEKKKCTQANVIMAIKVNCSKN